MDQSLNDRQLLISLRQEFDEFREEMRAALKKIDEDTDMISDHSLYVKKLASDSKKQIREHIKQIYSDVDMIYDLIGPLDQKLFPQGNSVRGTLETVRAELAKIKDHGGPEGERDDGPQE